MFEMKSDFMLEYCELTEGVTQGKETVDIMCEFWDRLSQIQYNYAKSVAALCQSRYGKLHKMFSEKPVEGHRPILHLWESLMEDMMSYSRTQLSAAYTIEKEIKPGLQSFSEEELGKQVNAAQHGRKVLNTLTEEQSRLLAERKKAYDVILAQPAEEMTSINKNGTTKQIQKMWIRARDSHAHAFNVTIPSIVEELNGVAVKRVEAITQSVSHFASIQQNIDFTNTSNALLAAQTSKDAVRYSLSCEPPPPPPNVDVTRSEMIAFCEGYHPTKKFLSNIQEKLKGNPAADRLKEGVVRMISTIRSRTHSGGEQFTSTRQAGSMVAERESDDEEPCDLALAEEQEEEKGTPALMEEEGEKGIPALMEQEEEEGELLVNTSPTEDFVLVSDN